MLKNLIEKLIKRESLQPNEIEAALPKVSSEEELFQFGAILALLRSKGETAEEMAAFIRTMQLQSSPVEIGFSVLDIVGTGGDGAQTVNISTGAAILSAACGVPVAKHGNRAVSSLCGSADVLEALGVEIQLTSHQIVECIRKLGLGFLFAPSFHPALKTFSRLRRALQIPTLFNLIAPLLNPAKADYIVYGIYDEKAVNQMAATLQKIGIKKGLVFHGNGTDELLSTTPTVALIVEADRMTPFKIEPKKYGLNGNQPQDLLGGIPSVNAELLNQAFLGRPGTLAETLALNAGAGIWIYGKTPTLEEGIELALEALKNGTAFKTLENWKMLTHQLRKEKTHG